MTYNFLRNHKFLSIILLSLLSYSTFKIIIFYKNAKNKLEAEQREASALEAERIERKKKEYTKFKSLNRFPLPMTYQGNSQYTFPVNDTLLVLRNDSMLVAMYIDQAPSYAGFEGLIVSLEARYRDYNIDSKIASYSIENNGSDLEISTYEIGRNLIMTEHIYDIKIEIVSRTRREDADDRYQCDTDSDCYRNHGKTIAEMYGEYDTVSRRRNINHRSKTTYLLSNIIN